jgi:hypothetical protein
VTDSATGPSAASFRTWLRGSSAAGPRSNGSRLLQHSYRQVASRLSCTAIDPGGENSSVIFMGINSSEEIRLIMHRFDKCVIMLLIMCSSRFHPLLSLVMWLIMYSMDAKDFFNDFGDEFFYFDITKIVVDRLVHEPIYCGSIIGHYNVDSERLS